MMPAKHLRIYGFFFFCSTKIQHKVCTSKGQKEGAKQQKGREKLAHHSSKNWKIFMFSGLSQVSF